ncbi:molybdopterin-binding protein [Saccharopolyspora sp. ID03-671]|uniref:molybdopterin-binding protein n=1 Tax=Saccharopolyspora sp. ID03-671 TaxID=3073066 RepID=UPI0032490798
MNPSSMDRLVPTQRKPLEPGQVLVTGDVADDKLIDTRDLDARAGEPLDVDYATRRIREVHRVRGVPLHEVLSELEPRWDRRHKMGRLNVVIVAISEDGFQVVLSLAEIDPEFGASGALLATRYNDETLRRPTLVLPGDGRASRYVRHLCRLRLVTVPPQDEPQSKSDMSSTNR